MILIGTLALFANPNPHLPCNRNPNPNPSLNLTLTLADLRSHGEAKLHSTTGVRDLRMRGSNRKLPGDMAMARGHGYGEGKGEGWSCGLLEECPNETQLFRFRVGTFCGMY